MKIPADVECLHSIENISLSSTGRLSFTPFSSWINIRGEDSLVSKGIDEQLDKSLVKIN